MNKKFMAAVLIGCMCVQGVSVMAEELLTATKDTQIENTMEETVASKEENSKVVTCMGEVTSVRETEHGYEILVGKEMEGIRFLVQPDTLVMDVDTLKMISVKDIKVGMNVTVVLDKNVPMTMSIPPMCSQQVAILVNSANKQVEVGYFDETLTNEANTLKLNVSKETVIQNNKGEKKVFTEEDIKNQDAIVVYTVSTRSIPAQTNPEYVMILNSDNKEAEVATEITETAEVTVNSEVKETKADAVSTSEEGYMTVRELATTLGYKLEWNQKAKTVTLTKEGVTIQLVVGKTQYTNNKETLTMKDAVKLENNTVYVPKSLVNEL